MRSALALGFAAAAQAAAFLAPAVLAPRAALAQPADCPVDQSAEGGGVLPLALDIGGRPGVPRGTTGQVYVGVPIPPPGAMACTNPAPPGAEDILRGDPGDVLGGPPSPDLLRGPRQPVVEVSPR
ncbi:MAG: hypothetical protein JSR21_13495 [Proteobacteria bacterium]|nr:hypothetical protein [Pseudomonadota bacterium]MBS0561059.1 hypothetical protein [Pseudomonadota bacterium]